MRSATEITAYRALSEKICAEFEEQPNQGPSSSVPTVGSARSGPSSQRILQQDLHGHTSPPRTRVSPQERHPTGSVVERGVRGHHAGVSDECSTGSTFLTAVQQPDGQRQEKSLNSGGYSNNISADTSTVSQVAVVQYGDTDTGGDGDPIGPARQTLGGLSSRMSSGKEARDIPSEPNAHGSEACAGRGEVNAIETDGKLGRMPGRLWGQDQSPPDSLGKRTTITSAR